MEIDLETFSNMDIDERMEFLKNGGELDNFSRIIAITCSGLKQCGAIISQETMIDYYKRRKAGLI